MLHYTALDRTFAKTCHSRTPWERRAELNYLNFSKSEVGQFIHEAIEESGGASGVNSELSLWREVIRLLHTHIRG